MKLSFIVCVLLLISIGVGGIIYLNTAQPALGKLIVIYGTTSVGKSSLVRELHNLHPHFQVLSRDDIMNALVAKKAQELKCPHSDNWGCLVDQLDEDTRIRNINYDVSMYFFEPAEIYEQINQALLQGKTVIFDTVFGVPEHYSDLVTFFSHIPNIKKILVYCPLQAIFDRIQQRNNSGVKKERRQLFSGALNFYRLYKKKRTPKRTGNRYLFS